MGEFNGDNFFITVTGWTVFSRSWIRFKKLHGTIMDIGDKRKITYKFGFTKKLAWPASFWLLFTLLVFGISSVIEIIIPIVGSCLFFVFINFHISFEEKKMISFMKELFNCEDDI